MKNNEQEIRRFAKKWSSCLVDIDLKAHKIQEDACLSDLNALLEQHKEMMCKQCKEQHRSFTYPGRPDPRDVSPYDIRSVHRARNPRKRT